MTSFYHCKAIKERSDAIVLFFAGNKERN